MFSGQEFRSWFLMYNMWLKLYDSRKDKASGDHKWHSPRKPFFNVLNLPKQSQITNRLHKISSQDAISFYTPPVRYILGWNYRYCQINYVY